MGLTILVIFIIVVLIGGRFLILRRRRFIAAYLFPPAIVEKVIEIYPHLTRDDLDMIEAGLRQFFSSCIRARKKMVAMPSKVVDLAWHEFILHTRQYHDYCCRAFGHYLHHTPFSNPSTTKPILDSLRSAWRNVCDVEDISANHPEHLPLLFRIDAELNIADGNCFSLESLRQIMSVTSQVHHSPDLPLPVCISRADWRCDCVGGCGGGCGGCGGA